MNKLPEPFTGRHAQALYRYIAGLEQGDLDTVASVLREAESDADLERALLEMSDVYQSLDHVTVSSGELSIAETMLQQHIHPAGEAELSNKQHSSRSPLPFQLFSNKERRQDPMQLHPHPDTSQQEENYQTFNLPPTRIRRFSSMMQNLVAVLLVSVLVAGFIFLTTQRTAPVGAPQKTPARVATLSGDGVISALDSKTGKILWKYETKQNIINDEVGLVVEGQIVYSLINGHVYTLKLKDGSLLWHYDVGLTPPTYLAFNQRLLVDQGVVYVSEISGEIGALQGAVYALRASDGKLLWKYDSTMYPLRAVKNGVVYVMNFDDKTSIGTFQALRAKDGSVLWSLNEAVNSAVVANDTVYILSVSDEGQSLKAIKQGSVLWSKPLLTDYGSHLYLHQSQVIVGKGMFYCAYKTSNGAQEWCTQKAKPETGGAENINASYPGATIADGSLYIVSFPMIASYQLKNGERRWSKAFTDGDGSLISFPYPVITDAGVIVISETKIIALRSNDGRELWRASLANVQILATEP